MGATIVEIDNSTLSQPHVVLDVARKAASAVQK
jgi:hypothetical protein